MGVDLNVDSLPTPTLPISSMDNNFLPIPSPFEMGVDLNVDSG
jgi:hypothetical protein